MKRKVVCLVVSCLMVLLLLSGCGVAQEEHDAVVAQLNKTQQELQTVQSELEAIKLESAKTELTNIQMAVVAMMVENHLSVLPNPVTVPTNDMSAFPDNSLCGIDKLTDTNGNTYIDSQDKDGYILYQHDRFGNASSKMLNNYVVQEQTKGTYYVDAGGTVVQVTTGYE